MATKVYIVYYSTYGHVARLAEEIKKGADSVEGIEATLWQVPETMPAEVLAQLGAPPKNNNVPIIKPDQLADADAFIFGFPTRFGMMPAQFRTFIDLTVALWGAQELAGKPAGFFFSTGSQGGGQESTALTAITFLAHHGMIFVPIGKPLSVKQPPPDVVRGGSPYGAGTISGDGSRQPSEYELKVAFYQGQYISDITKKLKKGGMDGS
ncbi:NAD(P)H dehydrogenase (quinone) FQR1-like [Impatiens glandulifera]|uniref:NAD(P)H dehydrogenase (quinone) FQR1-like n=1 Tax=Impatiens glandulifera TaxID=253017 RepID=UPI001FB17468|nr:NAD(P)H dehydrogenase (quinone) FQR1-like [Impatiens glandulifera]